MQGQRCAGEQFVTAGRDRSGRQMYQCAACQRRQTTRSASAFCGYRFPDDIIALAVRWYLRYRLPYADLVERLAERGVHVDASTVCDWVQHFTPLYKDAARPYRHRAGGRWAVDETYVRLAGRWVYAYRAIDEHGQVIDVYVSETRDTVPLRWREVRYTGA
jgi:transposase, IS6 family